MSAQHPDYLQKILTAQVYDVAIETPLDPAPTCRRASTTRSSSSARTCSRCSASSCAGLQQDGPPQARRPQARGDLRLRRQPRPGRRPVGQALGARAVIVMPTTTPAIKIDAVKRHGGEVVLAGELFRRLRPRQGARKDREAHLRPPLRRPRRDRRPGHHRHGDPAPAPKPIHAIFCCVGGGGLLAGVAAYVKRVRPTSR